MFRKKEISGKGVELNIKIAKTYTVLDMKEWMDKVLTEAWEIKRNHPDIKINIEVIR